MVRLGDLQMSFIGRRRETEQDDITRSDDVNIHDPMTSKQDPMTSKQDPMTPFREHSKQVVVLLLLKVETDCVSVD